MPFRDPKEIQEYFDEILGNLNVKDLTENELRVSIASLYAAGIIKAYEEFADLLIGSGIGRLSAAKMLTLLKAQWALPKGDRSEQQAAPGLEKHLN